MLLFPSLPTDFLRQLNHICGAFASPSNTWVPGTLASPYAAIQALQAWVKSHAADAALRPWNQPWFSSAAPSLPPLFSLIQRAVSEHQMCLTPWDIAALKEARGLVLTLCDACWDALPCWSHVCPPHPPGTLRQFLACQNSQQQECWAAFASNNYDTFIWDTMAIALNHVHGLVGGRSRALGCKVPDCGVALSRLGLEEELYGAPGQQVSKLVCPLLHALFGLHITLPFEGSIASLMVHQSAVGGEQGWIARSCVQGGVSGGSSSSTVSCPSGSTSSISRRDLSSTTGVLKASQSSSSSSSSANTTSSPKLITSSGNASDTMVSKTSCGRAAVVTSSSCDTAREPRTGKDQAFSSPAADHSTCRNPAAAGGAGRWVPVEDKRAGRCLWLLCSLPRTLWVPPARGIVCGAGEMDQNTNSSSSKAGNRATMDTVGNLQANQPNGAATQQEQQQYTWAGLAGGNILVQVRRLEVLLRLLLLHWPCSFAQSTVPGVGDAAAAAVTPDSGAARLATAKGAAGVAGGPAASPAARGATGAVAAHAAAKGAAVAAEGAAEVAGETKIAGAVVAVGGAGATTAPAAVKGEAGGAAARGAAGAAAAKAAAAGAAAKKILGAVATPAAARAAAGAAARAEKATAAPHRAKQGGTAAKGRGAAAKTGTGGCSAWKDEADLSLGVPDGSDCCMWLLLLAALLQQASAEAKQQLMQQQEMSLLLQLLHRVLLDQEQTGDKVGRAGGIWLADEPLSVTLQQLQAGVYEQRQLSADGGWGPVLAGAPMGVEQLVLMVLQSLLMTAGIGDVPGTAEQLLGNGCMLELTEGEL